MNTRRIIWALACIAAIVLIALIATRSSPTSQQPVQAVERAPAGGTVQRLPSATPTVSTKDQSSVRQFDLKNIRFNGVNLELPISVEDDGPNQVSPELMAEIVADISLIYGELTKYEIIAKNTERLVQINGQMHKIEKALLFSGGDVRRPKSHHGQFGLIAHVRGADTLLIPQPLLNAYKEAHAFRQANSPVIDSAHNFVDTFNDNGANPSASNRSAELFWAPANHNSNGQIAKVIVPQASSETLRRPSVLTFRKPSKEDVEAFQQLPEGSILADALVRSADGKSSDYIPLVWINGGWRIMLVKPGT